MDPAQLLASKYPAQAGTAPGLAAAYRQGQMAPAQAAHYEEAVRRGLVQDPYAEGRIAARTGVMGPVDAAFETFNRAVPGFLETSALAPTAWGTLTDAMNGRTGPDSGWGANWSRVRARQQGLIDQHAQDHPFLGNTEAALGYAGQILPAMATGGLTGIPAAASAARGLAPTVGRLAGITSRNAVTGSLVAGVNAAAQPGTFRERGLNSQRALLPGAVGGAVLPAAVAGAGRLGRAVGSRLAPQTLPEAAALQAEGIPVTTGQSLGDPFKALEDMVASQPMVGAGITKARQTGVIAFNRRAADLALNMRGLDLPPDVKAGNDALKYIGEKRQEVLDAAAGAVNKVSYNDALFNSIKTRYDGLMKGNPDLGARFGEFANQYVLEPLGAGDIDGKDLISRLDFIKLNANQLGDGSEDGERLANSVNRLGLDLHALASAQNPVYGILKDKADSMGDVLDRLQQASALSDHPDGLFTPAHLKSVLPEVATQDDRDFLDPPDDRLYDLADRADRVMGSTRPTQPTQPTPSTAPTQLSPEPAPPSAPKLSVAWDYASRPPPPPPKFRRPSLVWHNEDMGQTGYIPPSDSEASVPDDTQKPGFSLVDVDPSKFASVDWAVKPPPPAEGGQTGLNSDGYRKFFDPGLAAAGGVMGDYVRQKLN